MTDLAKKNAVAIGAGHSFIVFLGDGFYPLNVLNTLKMPARHAMHLMAKAAVTVYGAAVENQRREE